MNELFLHYVWKYKLIEPINLKTTDGEELEIIKNGEYNQNAGPDFLNAQLKIGETIWAGSIEIHVNASDWKNHGHENDKNYNNVILHVVLNNDTEIVNEKGIVIPSLELKYRILPQVLRNYEHLSKSKFTIACSKELNDIPSIIFSLWQERLVVERLEHKTQQIQQTLIKTGNNWEECFYRHLAANFGFKVNSEAFFQLASSLPLTVLSRYTHHQLSMEALIFGQSGLLEKGLKDKYLCELQNEYSFLQKKHGLQPIPVHLWNFLRLRPVNFPTIRLSQFANLIFNQSPLFSKLMHAKNIEEIYATLNVTCSDYWKNHYMPDKLSPEREKNLGKESIQNIIINTIAPFIFLYGREKNDQTYIDKALNLLSDTPEENNSIVNKFSASPLKPNNALESQSILQLYNNYCNKKKCYNCSIGHHIIQKMQTNKLKSV